MILGSLLLKREETAVHGFVRRSFFIKWDTGASADAPVSRKRKNHSAGYAHSARGGHLKSFCATKKAAAQNNVQRPFAILLCTLCALNSGGSGGSSLRRSSLADSSLRGSGLAGSSLRRSSLGNSGACGSSLRGRSSGRSRTTAGGHASSQSQSDNSDANILEFHINDLLVFPMCVSQRAFGSTSLRCYILVRFRKKSRGFWSKVIIYVKNLHSCHKISPKVKDFLAKIKPQKDGLLSAVEPAFAECRPAVDLLPGRVWYAVGTEQSLHRRAGNTK